MMGADHLRKVAAINPAGPIPWCNIAVWPDVSMLGATHLRRAVGYDFHHLRKKYDVLSMWGNIHLQWRLLQQHLETKGPGWCPLSEREERLFTNRSNLPGDDMKDKTSY